MNMNGPQQDSSSLPDGRTEKWSWEPLVLTKPKIQYLWERAMEFPIVADDFTYGNFELFMNMLTSPSNLFYEIGDGVGLVSVTNVRPEMDGVFHFVMYDRHLRGKENALKEILLDVFRMARLRRLSCFIPADRETGMNLIRRLGFVHEGKLRDGFRRAGKYIDLDLFGLLREEGGY